MWIVEEVNAVIIFDAVYQQTNQRLWKTSEECDLIGGLVFE